MDLNQVFELVSIILSSVSLFSSILLERRKHKKAKKRCYYKKSFKKILFEKIPCAEKKMVLGRTPLTGLQELEQCMIEIREKLYFYSHVDKKFTNRVFSKIQEIEDYIFDTKKIVVEKGNYQINYMKIKKLLDELYTIILPEIN